MTDRVHGGVYAGEFLTGTMNFFSFATTVPVGQTNVDTPVTDLGTYQTYQNLGVWTPVTVTDAFGNANTYSTLNAYLDAFYQQLNLDNLIAIFSGRANPVAISVKTFPASVNGANVSPSSSTIFAQMGYVNAGASNTTVFGSSYSSAPVYIVNIATEKSLFWTAGPVNGNYAGVPADNTNENGYNILSNNKLFNGLDQAVAYDMQDVQVIGGSQSFPGAATNQYAVSNGAIPFVSVWDASGASATGVNVMASQEFFLAGSLLA
jgi:hypothetical protein